MRARILALALAGLALSSASHAETINLSLGYLAPPFRTDRSFRSIDVGDPSVVDVRALSDRSVVFRTKKAGATNVVFYDESGAVVRDVNVVVDNAGSHMVELLHSTQRRGLISDYYRCNSSLCEYVSNDANLHFLEETRTEPAQNNAAFGAPGQTAPTAPAAPGSPSVPPSR